MLAIWQSVKFDIDDNEGYDEFEFIEQLMTVQDICVAQIECHRINPHLRYINFFSYDRGKWGRMMTDKSLADCKTLAEERTGVRTLN